MIHGLAIIPDFLFLEKKKQALALKNNVEKTRRHVPWERWRYIFIHEGHALKHLSNFYTWKWFRSIDKDIDISRAMSRDGL